MGEKSIRDMLAAEAVEAEAIAEAEERGERKAMPGQRARHEAKDPSQVYSVRVPVDRIDQLRELALERGVPPTALMRQWVVERLDAEATPHVVTELPARTPGELRLGPSRSAPLAKIYALDEPVVEIKAERPARRRAAR